MEPAQRHLIWNIRIITLELNFLQTDSIWMTLNDGNQGDSFILSGKHNKHIGDSRPHKTCHSELLPVIHGLYCEIPSQSSIYL